jgi:hypothetical protein
MSGFKNDINQLRPEFYQVVLTLSGGAGTYPTVDGNDNGAVYPQDHSQFATLPTTYAIGKRVARGHQRFLAIIENLSKYADCQVIDVQFASAGATAADNQPTSVTFTVKYDRSASAGSATNEGVLGSVRQEIGSPFQFTATTDGTITVDSTIKALRYLVGQAIGRSTYTKRIRVYDGGASEERDEVLTIAAPEAIADIYKDVAVTLVDAAETIDS